MSKTRQYAEGTRPRLSLSLAHYGGRLTDLHKWESKDLASPLTQQFCFSKCTPVKLRTRTKVDVSTGTWGQKSPSPPHPQSGGWSCAVQGAHLEPHVVHVSYLVAAGQQRGGHTWGAAARRTKRAQASPVLTIGSKLFSSLASHGGHLCLVSVQQHRPPTGPDCATHLQPQGLCTGRALT